jgi:hypothetical protein
VLSLLFVRTVDSFAVVTAPMVGLGLDELAGERAQDPRVSMAGALGLVLLAIGLPIDHWQEFPAGPGLVEAVWPTPMFRFLEEQHVAGPMFVSDGWAGPFLGVLYPREKAFFDPRFEAYSEAFVWDVYRSIRYGEAGWQEKLDRYGVQAILLKYTSAREAKFQGGRENLRQLLAKSPPWALVGFGDSGELFVRRRGPNAEIAARFDIPGVEPDAARFLAEPKTAAAGLARAVESGFHDNRVLAFAAVSVAAAGNKPLADKLLARADAQHPGDVQIQNARAAIAFGSQSPPPAQAP